MAEPITMSAGVLIWEFVLKPVADSIKKEYGDETKKLIKSSLNNAWQNLPFSKKEQEIIEAEIIEADSDILEDKEKFLRYIENNQNIPNETKQNTYIIDNNYGVQVNNGTVNITNNFGANTPKS